MNERGQKKKKIRNISSPTRCRLISSERKIEFDNEVLMDRSNRVDENGI